MRPFGVVVGGDTKWGRYEVALDPDAAREAIEYCYEQGWTDGLPVVPATQELVDRFLEYSSVPKDDVIAVVEGTDLHCTVEMAALNAVMAGCRPEYFPVVLAVMDAINHEPLGNGTGWQSTSGPAPLILINGKVRRELGFNSDGGVFGPGFRPNATVARTVGLIVRNVLRMEPNVLDQGTQGVPGRWSICFGETEEESPWEPLSVERGLAPGESAASATLIRTVEFIDNRVTQDAEEILWDFSDTISRTGALLGARTSIGICFGLEHAQTIGDGGFSKADVKAWLAEHCARPTQDFVRAGKGGFLAAAERDGRIEDGMVRVLPSVDGITILVAGARNAAMSLVFRVMGSWQKYSSPVLTKVHA